MSTYRQRANDYSNNLISKRIRPQPNNFTNKKFVPAFQEHQQTDEQNISSESAQIRKQEKETQNDGDADVVDHKSFTNSDETGKIRPASKSTSSKPVMTEITELKEAFSKVWTSTNRIHIPALQFEQKSYYTPSSIAYMEILFNMEQQLNGNEELEWKSPNYFSLPVRLYYCVLFYIIVYRAKAAAGKITKSESSWLRAFDRRYKDVSMPIAGPLVPIVTNISAILPDDSQFNFVYPDLPIQGTYNVKPSSDKASSNLTVHAQHFVIPSVILIADMLRQFCKINGKFTKDHFNDLGEYVPFKLSNGGSLGGIIFPPQTGNAMLGSQFAQLLYNPALQQALPETKDQLNKISNYWRRSKASEIPEIKTDVEFMPNGPQDATQLGEDLDWFEPCISQANVQASFFLESTNLSKIATLGGQSIAVQSLLSFKKCESIPKTISEWYPKTFRSAKSMFRSTTSTLDIDHMHQAAYALTCSKLNWTDQNGHRIGSRKSGLKKGPYWDNSKFNYLLDNEVDVLNGIDIMIQTHFYDYKLLN